MQLIQHPSEFKQGVRIVMLVLRNKDGGLAKPDHGAKKIITMNEVEWDKAVAELKERAELNDIGERIYASVDARNVGKAIHEFKRRQLDADMYDESGKTKFYLDIKNRFISCLASPPSRASKLFLIDCDSDEELRHARGYEIVRDNWIHFYPTKNGYHVITKPFNPNLISRLEIKQNAMMLVGY